MHKNRDGFSSIEGLLILIILGLIGFTGWHVYRAKNSISKVYENTGSSPEQQTDKDKTKKTRSYFSNKYKNASDADKCVAEYYTVYPESKPENQQPDKIYLAPPCPGVPQ